MKKDLMQLEWQFILLTEIRQEISKINKAAGETRFNPALTSELSELIGLMDAELMDDLKKADIHKYS
tara:strand:+ start:1276 stop:1476 length:201 start_codon:yes stop_codon:yes gene_type:complete